MHSAPTGVVDRFACELCGTPGLDHVERVVLAGVSRGKTFWTSVPHFAKCRLPCLGGGIRPRDSRPLHEQCHGAPKPASSDLSERTCPKCGDFVLGGEATGKEAVAR